MRLLHCGDLHPRINGCYAGKLVLDPSTGCSVAFEDCRKSLQAILDWEAECPCDLAVIGGDIWDNPKPTPAESSMILWFLSHLILRMPVVCISGNHDMDQNTTAATALEPLKWYAKLTREANLPNELVVMVQPDRALVQTGKGKVCVAGLPFPSKGRFQASTGEANSPEVVMGEMNDALRTLVRGMNAGLSREHINIMIAHGTVSGATVGEQPRAIAHDLLIPVDEMDGYDFVALNHIHQHQLVEGNGAYSGSLLCQSFGEMHEKKGWCVVEVERGQKPIVTHILNPHSRLFMDISYDRLMAGDVDALDDGVYRIVGEVSEADYPEVCVVIAKFEQTHPFVQNNLEVVKPEDRVRDASITTLLSADEAVERVVRTLVPEEAVSSVMQRHNEIQARA